MTTVLNILEDSSALHAEEEDTRSKIAQFDSIPDERAPAGSIVNQTLTKMSENENEQKPVGIQDAKMGSDKNEVINAEEPDHGIANDATKISKLSCAEEPKIHEGETSTDTRSFDQHVEEIISGSMGKEIITLDKEEISRSKGEEVADLEECREEATSMLEADLRAKNDDSVRVEESCIKDEDIDNNCSNNGRHLQVEGKDIESFQSSNKLEDELKRDKTEDASINVAETPYIHHGEATPEAAVNNEDDNNNKLENQPSDLEKDEVHTLGVATAAGESLKEASVESCIETKKDIHESKWQDKGVPLVGEIDKAEDSALLKCNEGGENGEDTSQRGLAGTNEDRKINPEKDGDRKGSWKQNEQQEKLGGDSVLIPEKSEISAAGENVEMSTEKLHRDYEEKEEEEEPALTSNSDETLSSTEKNLPLVDSVTQSASEEIEFPEKNGNDLNSEYFMVDKTRKEDSGATVEVKTEAQQEYQELGEPRANNEETEYQSEAQIKDIVSEDNSGGVVIKEIILQSNKVIEEHVNVPESSNSDDKIEIKDGGKIIPDKEDDGEEDTDIQTQKTATESMSEDEATIRDRTIEQSFQEESPKETEPTSTHNKIYRHESDAERNTQFLEAVDQPQTAVREEISKQHITSGSDEETTNIFPVDENKSQNIGEEASGEVGEGNNEPNLPPKFTETDKNFSHESNQNVESPDEVLDISLKKQEESASGEFSEKNAEDEDKDADIKQVCEEYSKKTLQHDEKEKAEEFADITTDRSKAGASGENPESTDSIVEEKTSTTSEKIPEKEEKMKSMGDRKENEAENQEAQVVETTEASQPTTESISEVCENSKRDAPESKPQAKEMENTVVNETLSSVPVDIEQGKEFLEDESCETKIKEEVEETSLTETKVTDTSDDFSEPKKDNDALNTEENNNSLVEVSNSTLGVFEKDDFSIKDSEAPSLEDASEKRAMKEVESLIEDQLEASDASPDTKDLTTIETKETSLSSVDSDERKDQEADKEEKRGMEVLEVTDEGGQQVPHDIKDQALTTSTPLLEVQLEQTSVDSELSKIMDQTIAGHNDSYVAAEKPSIVHFEGFPDNKKDNADEEIDHKNTVEDPPIQQRNREKVIVLADQSEANKLDIVEGEKSTVELVASMDSENAALEEEELAERSEDSPEVVLVQREEEETTATPERISQKENLEENNNNLVEISTSTLGVFNKYDLNTNDSEAASLGVVSETPAMKEAKSSNEEQSEISVASPDMKDLTIIETKADSLASVDIDESKEKETKSEEYQEVDVPEAEDEGRQQISHDIKDQALNTGINNEPTTAALLEVQLEQTFMDSDTVLSKDDFKTIETSKTISEDDAVYVDAETPFVACFEGSSDDKKENADQEFDQKNMVGIQPIEQREREQVVVLGDQNETNKLEIVEDEKSTAAVSKHDEVLTSVNSENAVPEDKELAERTEGSSEVVVVEGATATLERISQQNIEEKVKATDDTKEHKAENQEGQVFEATELSQATTEDILEACKRPETVASESKTEDKEIDNAVESGTLPSVSVGIEKGENESCETKNVEQVEEKTTTTSDDFSINNSEAASLEDVNEKPALKEVKSLNEEQLEASDASPGMKDFTSIETAADARKKKETDTEGKRDGEILEVADEDGRDGIKDQAQTTSTPLVEVQLEQTFVDSDNVPSKEDIQTIETSKTTDKTIAGDDASCTPFVAHIEVKKENVDERTDQKNTVEDLPIEQREREQVIVLGDQNEANKLEIVEDEKSNVAVSKHDEVVKNVNSEDAVLEEKELAERTEDSSEVVVERERQEETTSTVERTSLKENVEENMKAINDAKENEAESQEPFNELQHDRIDENISCESKQNAVSPDEVLDIPLKKQDEIVLGEVKHNNADEDEDVKIKLIEEDYSKNELQNDEKEKAKEFADITTEGSKEDASGENPESTEFTAEEETPTAHEEIIQEEEREEKIKPIDDDDTKEIESENHEVQVFVTTEEGQETAESILELCEKSKIDASEPKPKDTKTENTVGCGKLSSVSVDTEERKEFPEENGSGNTKMKEEVEETSLTETKVTDTTDNSSEPKKDTDALTTEENNNKQIEISTSTLGVFEKDDFSTNDSEVASLKDVSEKPDMKDVKSLNEEQPETSDASPDMRDLKTIETKANSLGSVDIDGRNDKEAVIEEHRHMEALEVADEGETQISHDMKDQALTAGTPLPEVPLPSKEDFETIETSKTTDETIAGDDEEIDEKNTIGDHPIEQKEREQVTVSADQNEVNELEIERGEKSTIEASEHIEVVRSMKSESAVLEEKELAERTEDTSAVVVEREGQEETSATLERISRKENIGDKITAPDDTKENEAAGQEVLLATNVGSEATVQNILKVCESSKTQASESKQEEEIQDTVGTLSLNSAGTRTGKEYPEESGSEETMMKKEVEVTNAESEKQAEPTNLTGRNISNASDDSPEPKKDHGASTTQQNNHNLVENSSYISEVLDKDDRSTNVSKSESITAVSENTVMKEGTSENEEQPRGSDAAPDMKDITTIEAKAISSSSFNNYEKHKEESSSENVPEVGEEVISHEPCKLEIRIEEKPTVRVSEHTIVSTGVNNESALLEEEGLSERTDKSPAPAVIEEEKEAAEPKAGSPSIEEEPAISKNSELLIEKSLPSDESERRKLAEDKDKDAMIKLKDDLTNTNDEEKKLEDFQDMNCEGSKEETKIMVEKISQMEETEEKEVRSIDDTKENEAAYQEIPVADAAGHATGENNLKVCEISNEEASVTKSQEEEIEKIVGAFPSSSVGTEAGRGHPHVNTDGIMLQREVEVTYAESTEEIEATSLIERKSTIPLDSYLYPKEDRGSLTTEENNNNLVDHVSPTAGVLKRDKSNIIDPETEILGVTSDKTTMKCDKPVNEEQLEGSDVAAQTKDVAAIEGKEEEIDSKQNKSMEVPEETAEGLQQKSHQIEEKSETTDFDHEKEPTTNTPHLDEQLVQTTNVESSMVPPKEEPEITESTNTAEDTPARDEEKEREDGRDQKHNDQDVHMPPDLKIENDISDTEEIEQLQKEQVSDLEIVKDEKSSVGLEEEKIATRTEDNSVEAGGEREAAELKEETPRSEEEPARTKNSELLVKKISVTDGASQATGENNLKVSGTSNTEVSVSKPQEDIESIVETIPSVPIEIEPAKEYPQVHTSETKLQQEVEVTDGESSREQIEATSLIDRQFSCTLDNISELKEDHGDLTTENNNNTLVDNASPRARVFEKDESNITDSETELISVTSNTTILKDDKPVNEDQLEGSDAATQMKDVTTIETKNSGSVTDERQEEETNSEENKIMEVPEVEDEGLQEVSLQIAEKAKMTGLDHEKESTAITPQLDEQLVQIEIDSTTVPSKEEPETIGSSKTTEKSTAEVSKDIEVVMSTNDKTVVVEKEKLAGGAQEKLAVAGVEREMAELSEGTPSSEEPAKSKSGELQEEKAQDMNEESKEKNEATFLIERNLSNTLDDLSEPKEDRGALTTEENNVDLVDNSSTSVGVSDKDENTTNESSLVSSKEETETIESSKATEDTPARDEEKKQEDHRNQQHKGQAADMPSNLKTENEILVTEDIEQLKREQVSGLEDQNETSEFEIVKDEKSSVKVSNDIEVVTCSDSKNIVLEEGEIAARTEDNSAVAGVEREMAELKEGTLSTEEEPTKNKTCELLEEKVEFTYEDDKPVNEDQVEVSDAASHTKDVTNIQTEPNNSNVNNGDSQGEGTNSEENRSTEVPQVTDEGGQKMSDDIKEKDVTTSIAYEKELTISTPLLNEKLVQIYTNSSMVPSKEDQELVRSSKTTGETAAIDEKSTSFEISKGASILASSDNEKENSDGGDQKHQDQDQLMSPDQESNNDILDADQNETCKLEIVKDEKSVGEVLKQIEDTTCSKGEETVQREEHTKQTKDSSAIIGIEEEPAEFKEGSPISEEEPTGTKNSELLLEKGHHTVETTDNESIKEELKEQGIITAEEEEGTEVKVLDSEFKQHTEATELTEVKESATLEDHAKQNINTIDISSFTSTGASDTGNKDSSSISKVYEREAAAEVLKKDEPTIDDAKHMSVTVAIEETGLKNVVPEHEQQDKGSDFATENESVTTILTQTTIVNDKDIRERQEENFSTEKKGIPEEAESCHLKTDHCAEKTGISTSVQYEQEVTEITDKAEETHVTEHTTENKLLQNELEVAGQGVSEVETEKSNASENILEQNPEPESNVMESDAVSAVENIVTEVTARNSESKKQIESLNNFAKANDDVSSLTTIETSEEETRGEESKQTLLRDSDNGKQKTDGEEQKHTDQDELMPPDLKTVHVIPSTEDIEQWKREQVSGLADQNEACELEPVKVEESTVEVPKDVEVVTSSDDKHAMLEKQDLAERAEEDSAAVGIEREAAELEEGTLSCKDEPVKTNSSELLAEKVEVTDGESKKQKGALDLPDPKEGHSAYTIEEKNDNLVNNSSPSVEVLEKDEKSTNDSDNAALEDGKPVNEDQVEVSDDATETKDVTIIETEAHSSSVNNDERQEKETVNSKEDQGSSKTTEETADRDDSCNVDAKTASLEISEGDSILKNSDNEKEIADGGYQQHKDQDEHICPNPKSENDILGTEDTEQQKTEQVIGLARQNETCELEIVKDDKPVDEMSKHIEDATCIKGKETVLEKDEHTGRTEDSPAVIGVEGESAEPKEGSPISEEEPTNTHDSEFLVEKAHHTVETTDDRNIKEELAEHSIESAKEKEIEVRVLNSELKQHIETMELREEKEAVALEDQTEALETCNEESSSITNMSEREAEPKVLKKDELTTDDDTKHVSVTVAIEETGLKDVAPEHREQDKRSEVATENESVTSITTESAVLNDTDSLEREEEGFSTEKMGILEDDSGLKTDYCVEETDKTSTMQLEREVTTSSVLDSQDYPQQSLEEKDNYVTEEVADKAAEAYLTEHTTEKRLLQNEHEVAKQGVFEVETEKSNASEDILEQTAELESNARESDAVSLADKTVNEGTAANSESIKQIESLENFSNAIEECSSFTTIGASQEETHGEESKKTLFRTCSLESWQAEKNTKAEIIKKEDTSNISEILPCTLVGEDTGLNDTIGEDKQENNFAPVTEARDVTSTDTVKSRLDTINTDGLQEKSSCSEKNGGKQSPEIADEAAQEMHENIGHEAPPKRVEHEEDFSFTPILDDNLKSSLATRAEEEGEEGSLANADSPFVVHATEEKRTESNPDVIKPEVYAELGAAVTEKESENVIQKVEDEDFNRPHIVINRITKSDTKDVEIARMEEDSSSTAQSEACALEKEEERCSKDLKHRTDGTFTDDENVVENLRSSLKITEGWEVAAALESGGQSDNRDSTKFEKVELSAEKDHLIQDSTSEDVVESTPRQQFPVEKEEKTLIEAELGHHLNIPSNEEETSATSLTTKEVHGGFDKAGENESNDKIKEQNVDSEVKLMELQISSARDAADDEVKYSNLSSTETLKAEDSNKPTMIQESGIKDDHPTTKRAESTTKASEEDMQNENTRRPTEVPIVALQAIEQEMEKDIKVEEDSCSIMAHIALVEVLNVESSPKVAQLDNKALKRSDLDDQRPETIKSVQVEQVIGEKDEMASFGLIAQTPPKVHGNADAHGQNLVAENVDVDQGDEFIRTYEVVSKDELLQMGDDEKFQNQTAASLERKQEQGIQMTSQIAEEKSKAMETSDHIFSDSKTAEETYLEAEDSLKFTDHNSGTKIYEGNQMDSSSKSKGKGVAPNVILRPYEVGEQECIDSLSGSQKITDETKLEEALNLKKSKKVFEYVQEVHSDEAVTELEGREYPIKTAITDWQPEENQSEKTTTAEKTTNTRVLDEKINKEMGGGKIFLQNFLSKTHQENDPETLDPSKKKKETFHSISNDNQHQLKSEALKKHEVEVIEDKLPCDVEGKNITEAARSDNENRDAQTNATTREVLMSQSEEESGVRRVKGHITDDNENTQGVKKLDEGSLGKADVESNCQQNRKTDENVRQVPQISNEETRLEVSPENAEPGRAIGISIILEGTQVGEEKIKHLGDVLTKKSTPTDAEKASISNISEKPTEEPLQAAIHLDEARDKAAGTGTDQTQEEENPHVKNDIEGVSGATEIVEPSKDVDVKVVHKKHHNILSGVGSKVKHSISKVKKAITGKSSHSKSPPK